jgi:Winged helix DNA-binding domain
MPSRRSSEVLNIRAPNRALLERQLLLDRRPAPVADTLEHLVGTRAQEPQAPYIGLWSRLDAFLAEDVSDLIVERRAVRGGLMRATIHLVTAPDWARLRPLLSPVLARGFEGSPFSKCIAGVDLSELVLYGRELLTDQPRSRAELGPLLAERWPGIDPTALEYAVSYLEPIVQVPPRGLWSRSGQARWMSASAWLTVDIDAHPSLEEMVLRYLAAFGPASVQDVQAWSGLSGMRQIIDSQRDRLRSLRDPRDRELLMCSTGHCPILVHPRHRGSWLRLTTRSCRTPIGPGSPPSTVAMPSTTTA